MKRKSNSRESKIKVNSLDYSLFEDLVDHEAEQIKGGHSDYSPSDYPPDCIAPLRKHIDNIEPFIVIVP